MKLLYISHLSTNIAAGLNWSVPASVNAQSKIDNVLWINMTDKFMPHWEKVRAYHNIKEYGVRLDKLDILPPPFNQPDLVIFEGFYYMDDVKIAKMLRKCHVPYLIIPRSSITHEAMHNHAWLKKWIAHKLFFDNFVINAKAIQYLTKREAESSVKRFKTPYIIVPNGISQPGKVKDRFSKTGIKAVFIGRVDIYQKGLDILLKAINNKKEYLYSRHFHLDIYGPQRYDYKKVVSFIHDNQLNSVVSIHGEIGGDNKEKVLLNSDLFILPSRFEGHPMGLIEALSYGIPCLVTAGSNMKDEIVDFDAGWGCDNDEEILESCLINIFEEKDKFKEKSENAIRLAKQYDWSDLALRLHKEVSSLLNR